MTIELVEEPRAVLEEYARVPIVFTVDRLLDVTRRGDDTGGFALSERTLKVPYRRITTQSPAIGPLHWARRFDLSNWASFTTRFAARIIGGATVAFDTPALTML
jgi:hypothetical protein